MSVSSSLKECLLPPPRTTSLIVFNENRTDWCQKMRSFPFSIIVTHLRCSLWERGTFIREEHSKKYGMLILFLIIYASLRVLADICSSLSAEPDFHSHLSTVANEIFALNVCRSVKPIESDEKYLSLCSHSKLKFFKFIEIFLQ